MMVHRSLQNSLAFSSLIGIFGYVSATPLRPRDAPDPGTYVSSLSECPALPARSALPTSVHDLRPDDFSYAMAIGDSITAGAFLRGIQTNVLKSFSEWRGQSYAGGGDPGAITVPNLIKHYSPSLTGGSVGSNDIIELCFGPLCVPGALGYNANVDQMNAALSGALASNIPHEVNDYLIPQVKARNIPASAYKYMSLQIGSNDICQFCIQAEVGFGPESADDFEVNIRKALEAVRKGIPNTVVNIVGVLPVSGVYNLTLNEPYCSQLIPLPHANIECSCMLLGGEIGAASRAAMDSLQAQYNERLIKIVKDYQTAKYSDFAVLWQPPNIPLAEYPVQVLSNVDCFHPSLAGHELIASGVWNRLVGNADERAVSVPWSTDLTFRCLEAGDRIHTDTLI